MIRVLTWVLAAAGLAATAGIAGGDTDSGVEEARGLAKSFQQSLKAELMAAMSEGGPENAIGVCNIRAPEIAAKLSEESGWQVGRTALRLRNPGNAPTPREREILRSFEEKLAEGVDPGTLEAVAKITRDGERLLHYMKAIPTAPVCTTCHGQNVDPGLLAKIREVYPKDEAIGFAPGELRGAFTFYKPLGKN